MGCIKLDILEQNFSFQKVAHNNLKYSTKYHTGSYLFGAQGSEKDDEITGVTGSHITTFYREADLRTGQWWTPDNVKPNASESPYAMFGRNPVFYNDVLGDTIRITSAGGNTTYTQGMSYNGNDKFIKQTVDALNTLNSKNTGGEMLTDLSSSKTDYSIMQVAQRKGSSTFGNGYDDNLKAIGFNPSTNSGGIDENGSTSSKAFISLGHELAHAWDADNGTLDKSPWYTQGNSVIRNAEKFSTHIENKIRAEHGIPLRKYYGIDNSQGNSIGTGLLLNKEGRSLFYNQTTIIKIPKVGLIMDAVNNNTKIVHPYIYK